MARRKFSEVARPVKYYLGRLGGWRWFLLGVLIFGAGLVAGAFFVVDEKGPYFENLMLHFGTALAIFAGLVVVGRLVEERIDEASRDAKEQIDEASRAAEKRIDEVSDAVGSLRHGIDELKQSTETWITGQRAADADAIRELRRDVAEENVLRLLRRSLQLGAVDEGGVRVRFPEADLWLRFADVPAGVQGRSASVVRMSVEGGDGDPFAGADEEWSADEPADRVLARLAEDLQRIGQYPGDEVFDAGFIFRALSNTFEKALSSRTAGGPATRGAIIELVGGDWAITSFGLENAAADRRIPVQSLRSDPARAWADLMADTQGVADDEVAAAFDTAVAYHRGADRRRARERLLRAP